MFKIGDKVICLNTFSVDNIKAGDILIITSINGPWLGLKGHSYDEPNFRDRNFKLYEKKELNNEVEYLNAFQRNFKEGI